MLGDTITITIGGTGGTDKVLKKINQDNYGASYLLIETTGEYQCKVQHNRRTSDRHFIEITRIQYQTESLPEMKFTSSFVMTNPKGIALASVSDLAEGLVLWLTEANLLKLLGNES